MFSAPAALGQASQSGSGSDWPMFGANPQRTGSHNGEGPSTKIKWKFKAYRISTPLLSGNTVYVGRIDSSEAYSVCALEAKSGEKKWCTETIANTHAPFPELKIQAGLVYIPGTIYSANDNDIMYECVLDAKTGEQKWCNELEDYTDYSIISDGIIYTAGTYGGNVRAVDLKTGQIIWESKFSDAWSFITLRRGTLYLGSRTGDEPGPGLLALDPKNGEEKWMFETEGKVYTAPEFAGGSVFLISNRTYALDAETGEVRWEYDMSSPFNAFVADGETVYIGGPDPDVRRGEHVVAIDAVSGEVQWQYAPENNWMRDDLGTMRVLDGILYIRVFGGRGGISAIDAQTGEQYWAEDVLGITSLQAKGDVLYAGSEGDASMTHRAEESDGTWSAERNYYQGFVEVVDAKAGKRRWEIRTEGNVNTAPVLSDKMILVKDDQGYLYAADIVDYKWKFSTEGEIRSSPAVVDGTVFIGSNDNHVYALDAENGDQTWRFETGGKVQSSPAVVGGTVFVGSGDNHLYAIDAANGTEKWSIDTGGGVASSPAVVDGTVYVGSNAGSVLAINAETGEQKWRFKTVGGILSSPAVSDGRVIAGSQGGFVYVIDAQRGSELWSYSIGVPITWSSPAVANNNFFIGTYSDGVWGFGINGRAKWVLDTEKDVESSPAFSEGIGSVGTPGGSVFLFDWDTGLIPNTYQSSPMPIKSSPAIVDQVSYVGGDNALVQAVHLKKGFLDWLMPVDGAVISSPAISNGVLYVGTQKGTVYAIE